MDKKPHPLHNEIANYANKDEHQKRAKTGGFIAY